MERGARSLDDAELKAFIAESATHDMVVMVGLARKSAEGLFNTELVIHRGKFVERGLIPCTPVRVSASMPAANSTKASFDYTVIKEFASGKP